MSAAAKALEQKLQASKFGNITTPVPEANLCTTNDGS